MADQPTYIAVHMVFNNLPPALGIFAKHNMQDKIWRDVTFSATCVLYSGQGLIIKISELSKDDDFDQYLADNRIGHVVHTSADQAYIFMSTVFSRGKKVELYNTAFEWEIRGPAYRASWDYSQNIPADGVSISDHLTTWGRKVSSLGPVRDGMPDHIKLLSSRLSKVEKLHAKFPGMPDPVAWARGTTSDAKNEYTDFMNRFEFGTFTNCSIHTIYGMLKLLR